MTEESKEDASGTQLPERLPGSVAWWIVASIFCFVGYAWGFAWAEILGIGVWIIALAAGIGVGCAIRAIRLGSSWTWMLLILHFLATAYLVLCAIMFTPWTLFVYHWRRFFGL